VTYQDANCNPRVGVPPESLYITWQALSGGNARINDKSSNGTYADDSTNYNGQTRFTFASLSGCGGIRLSLAVSGAGQGHQDVQIRSVDSDIDLERRVVNQLGYDFPGCDLNWDGISGGAVDQQIIAAHNDHWRRNALHGTPQRLTNLCESGCEPLDLKTIGSSDISWSPNGRWLAFTIETPSDDNCRVHIVSADPSTRALRQFTFGAVDDYGPSWSPLGHELAVGRDLWKIIRKGIPGVAADTNEYVVSQSGSATLHGDLTPAISPDGQIVAFARKDQTTKAYNIWKVPIGGGTATQLTFFTPPDTVNEQYPQWSADGQWIVYDRENSFHNGHRIWKVKVDGTSKQEVFYPGPGMNAATPAFSPDGLIMTAGIGAKSETIADIRAHTLDYNLAIKKPILNYPDSKYAIAGLDPVLSPRIAPDGTRLGLRAAQLYAVRRNMNLPPIFTNVGGSVHDTTAVKNFSVVAGQDLSFTVTATDPDDGVRTYHVAYVDQPGMSFDPGLRLFFWDNAGPTGTYYVKFWVTNGTASGGAQNGAMDAIIAKITVTSSGAARMDRPLAMRRDGSGDWIAQTEPVPGGDMATLHIVDVAGRRVARISGPSGGELRWDRMVVGGRRATPGVYLYDLVNGAHRHRGKIVILDE